MSSQKPEDHGAHYAARRGLLEALRRELSGPVEADGPDALAEVLTDDAPITRYVVGVLHPQREATALPYDPGADPDAGLDEAPLVAGGGPDDGGVPDPPTAGDRKPSSAGLTFAVAPAIAASITVTARAAVYEPVDENGNRIEAGRATARTTDEQRENWRRRQLTLKSPSFDVTSPGRKCEPLGDGGAELHVHIRRPSPVDGTVTVTVTLVNGNRIGENQLADAHALFQPELRVTAEGGAGAIVERQASRGSFDAEVDASRLLHRHAPTFAVGHGCAAEWTWRPAQVGLIDKQPAAVEEVRTQFLPHHEVLLADSNAEIERIAPAALSMNGLATRSDRDIVADLTALAEGYAAWVAAKRAEMSELADGPHEDAARQQIESCAEALRRLRAGIEVLADKPDVMRAFRLANQVMTDQRSRGEWIKDGRQGSPDRDAAKWRPFQIAFVLLCLAGIEDPKHPDRKISDLLWFPTGGGKTEAYLGLIAFTTFLRRLRRVADGGGVTVLMRYTLRLLTLQQFERAAILMCAMEKLRRTMPEELGGEEISLGMWVGQSATPNTLERARTRLDDVADKGELDKENPVQLQVCPWCGTGLDHTDYCVDESARRMWVRCRDSDCDFAGGLPVHLVDEAVYAARPTLVIATVDKFASMPWRAQTAALFNRDRNDGTPPPELIVQDELHLISGPLGTLTGLYETAVDALCDTPKVIASTATIRRAADQGRSLFDREVRQFPPAGLDARDSWFAVEASRDDKASREYVGLFAPGTSQSTLLIRTYATLLHQAMRADLDPVVRDTYWTLVGYFNSLRLLSAAKLQVEDDVRDYLRLLAKRDGIEPREVDIVAELTSRLRASEVPAELKNLDRRFGDPEAVDVLLATNMIAVGVDVGRLGLMAVMGQPQTTAEYIQATSRVGRRHPGMVAVMLNSTRARDRSHYENFQYFHSALYRQVESTSVTPFSSRSRDRGLHAVIVALTRILVPELRENHKAGDIVDHLDRVEALVRPMFLDRVARVAPKEAEATEAAFDEFIAWWREAAVRHGRLLYDPYNGQGTPSLLRPFDDRSEVAPAWSTLWSMRDVDAETALFMEATR
ncbi:helicase-related protein [Streptomyces beihaiensis]|uniref:Helicase-related protein n=1 Tax=Streptomyces beihaiensis TaxID=2984495 RepID=A0ABT3U2W4_9ACTN|nr:helicase-related protein [Streptomyces beihaiensis]MCX3063636.1 helicase-related protein [Streptomyces beihaiensis]